MQLTDNKGRIASKEGHLMSARILAALFILSFSFFVAPAACAVAPATRPAAHPTTQQVKTLVDSLSSDEWKLRQKAMDELAAMGSLAESELRRRLKDNRVMPPLT